MKEFFGGFCSSHNEAHSLFKSMLKNDKKFAALIKVGWEP